MPGIFISYRREDTAGHAGRIFDRLREKFGQDKVFMDVADIEPGVDFVEAIDRAVGSCEVLLVIIGKQWLTCTDASGKRRLEDPKDFIRLETATALRRNIRVIPVLVQGASMPGEDALPDELKTLARRQATDIIDTHWDASIEQLINTVAKLLSAEPKPAPSRRAGPGPLPPPTSPSVTGDKKRVWLVGALVVLVLALGGVFFASSTQKVAVPELVGYSLDEAQVRLQEARLQKGPVEVVPSDRSPGIVIKQDPPPGTRVARGLAVNLVLSQGAPMPPVETPDLLGLALDTALHRIRDAGLTAGEPVRKPTREAAVGTVLEQTPRPGTPLARGTAIELVVAAETGEPAMLTVPDVTGLDIKGAIANLKHAGLKTEPNVARTESAKAKPGTVLKQSARPGSQLRPDETISLVYAVAPREEPAGGEIVLPDFTGSPVAKVEDYVTRMGLALAPIHEKATTEQRPGTVLAQRPPAKTHVQKGAEITLLVAASATGEHAMLPAPQQSWPEDGYVFNSRSIALRWKRLPGAASYSVEVDTYAAGKWHSDVGKPWKVARNIEAVKSPGYKFEFTGQQTGRWRVWAVDKEGREGEKSEWRTFRYTK